MTQTVVLGVDSSTQSTKVLAVDLESGEIVSEGRAAHTGQDIQDPQDWWVALAAAVQEAVPAGAEVAAISVGGQQHGMVAMDAANRVICPAPLWNNVDAAADAERLNSLADFAREVGTYLVASITIAKLAHLARTDPATLARLDAVALPHDWLNLKLTGRLATDRGEASGSGWWSPGSGQQRRDLLSLAIGDEKAAHIRLPEVCGPHEVIGRLSDEAASALGLPAGIPVAPGTGDNMAAALGVGARPGELVISLGTSGTAFAVSEHPVADEQGEIEGFADATGRYLPLTCMLNCTRVLDTTASMVGLERDVALELAGAAAPGADGVWLMPYLAGERLPNLPHATGSLFGLTMENARPDSLVRAALDGVAAGLAYGVDALAEQGVSGTEVVLVGGGSRHPSWRQAIADATGLPVHVRGGREHAALGAAMQAIAVASGTPIDEVIATFRPATIGITEPRPEYRDAFRLPERRALIEQARAS
ncbi:MAG: xylulokinase [Chloroflexota bacterium]|nr:xylulokinase [Chloroflexota bacterium]